MIRNKNQTVIPNTERRLLDLNFEVGNSVDLEVRNFLSAIWHQIIGACHKCPQELAHVVITILDADLQHALNLFAHSDRGSGGLGHFSKHFCEALCEFVKAFVARIIAVIVNIQRLQLDSRGQIKFLQAVNDILGKLFVKRTAGLKIKDTQDGVLLVIADRQTDVRYIIFEKVIHHQLHLPL